MRQQIINELSYKIGRRRIRAGSVAWWLVNVGIAILGIVSLYIVYCTCWIMSVAL